MRKLLSISNLLWVALVLALVGSLRHVAWGFSTLESGDLIAGYVQAVAVDIGLFALAVGIQKRRREGRGTRGLWVGVGLFSAVSTYANLLHGLEFASGLNLETIPWLSVGRPFVLSAVLPMLVVYLAEIAAADFQHAVKVAERERKVAERKAVRESFGTEQNLMPVEQAREIRTFNKYAAMNALVEYLNGHPNATLTEAGQAIGRSKTTVAGYLNELETAGRIHRNGDGVTVLER